MSEARLGIQHNFTHSIITFIEGWGIIAGKLISEKLNLMQITQSFCVVPNKEIKT